MKIQLYPRSLIAVLMLTIVAFAGLQGCSESSTNPGTAQGDIKMYMVDSPGDYDSVIVVVTEVTVHRSTGDDVTGWIVINDSTRAINLLSLTNGTYDILGASKLDVGTYSQIRLKIGTGSHVVVNGVAYDLDIPSGAQSGLKLNHQFEIKADALYELTLDFDASRSIHLTGNNQYKMTPVIRVVANVVSGSISGVVLPLIAFAEVSTIVGSDTVTTYPNLISGNFKLMVLPAGTYPLIITSGVAAYGDSIRTGIVVTAGQNRDMGTINLRLQ